LSAREDGLARRLSQPRERRSHERDTHHDADGYAAKPKQDTTEVFCRDAHDDRGHPANRECEWPKGTKEQQGPRKQKQLPTQSDQLAELRDRQARPVQELATNTAHGGNRHHHQQ
jgi:hypothetical protein